MRTIPLTRSLEATVDDEDFERLEAFRWQAAGGDGARVYARRTVSGLPGHRVYMHREVVGAGPNDLVDHINGNTLDNRRANLRICTAAENARNRAGRPEAPSFKGVRRTPAGRWAARITVDYRELHLGHFESAEEAARAYDAAALLHYGRFARTNFQQRQDVNEVPHPQEVTP